MGPRTEAVTLTRNITGMAGGSIQPKRCGTMKALREKREQKEQALDKVSKGDPHLLYITTLLC